MQKVEFNPEHVALAYLITFRAYGTWLHGDSRSSVDRFHNRFGSPKLPPNPSRRRYEERLLKQSPVQLDKKRRAAIETAVRETCAVRNWTLWAFNIRTNHVHSVISARCKPEVVLNALKANATRTMRSQKCWLSDRSPWSYRGSRRYLWNEQELINAIEYVLYDQGLPL